MFIQPEDADEGVHANTVDFQAWFNRQINRTIHKRLFG